MPKYLALTPQQAAEVKQFGAEPSEYVYEVDSGEAVPKAEVPTTWTEEIGAGLKSILPGVADAVLSPLSLAGQTADLVRQGVGTYDPNNPSDFSKWAKSAKEGIVDLVGAPDPRASWLSTGVGRGLGNLAGIATPAALGRKLTGVAANRLAGGLGGAMMAESTIGREMEQQADAGVQDPMKTAVKGLISGAGGGYLESRLGAGSIIRNLTKPTGSLGGRLGRGLVEFGKGGITEGLQQGLENGLITEGSLQLGDQRYDPLRAALIGGLVQGPASVGLDMLAGKPKAPAENAAVPAGEKPTGVAALKTGRAGKPAATEITPLDTSTKIPAILEARRKKLDYDPPTKDPVHKLIAKLPEEMPLDEAMLKSLYDTWGGDEKNMPKVEAAAQKLYDDYVTTAPVKPLKTVDLVSARLKVRKNYEGVRSTLQKNIADINKKDEDIQKFNAENPTAVGTITQNQQELARNAALRKEYEGQLVELDNQEMLELSAAQPVLPTKGMDNPRVPVAALPAVGTTDTYAGAPGRPLGPAIPVRDATPTAGEQQVAQTMQDYAADAGTIGLSTPMDPARAKALQEQRAQQEGEQGSPFGESSTRYSGIPILSDLFKLPKLGSGNEFTVYQDRENGRVLKVSNQVQDKDKLQEKLSALAALPNVLPSEVISETEDGRPIVAQPFADGPVAMLADVAQKPSNEDIAKLLGLRLDVSDMSYRGRNSAGQSVIVRDVKPDNIVITPDGPKVIDAEIEIVDDGSQIRYSGFDVRPMLEAGKEALRRGRKWLTPDQVQDGTFMLSGVAGLNYERPWGMQVGKDGSLPVSGLVPKMAANIPKGEMEAYKAAGFEKWLEGKGKVGREELQAWMMENGPVVEVKELRPRVVSAAAKEYAQLQHKLETYANNRYQHQPDNDGRFIDWMPAFGENGLAFYYEATNDSFVTRDGKVLELPDEIAETMKKMHRLSKMQSSQGSPDSTIGRYGVEPRPVEEMEGPVELLVRVPGDPKWTGGHHGDSGHNTLGFGRANVETLPDGRKVLHVFEAQSDWGQRVRKEQEKGESSTPSHPLLDESNRLILKAAVKYALDNNLDGIAISDAETAMITEGHDAVGGSVRRVDPNHYTVKQDGENGSFGPDWASGTYVQVTNGRIPPVPLRVDKPDANVRYKEYAQELHDAGYGQKEGAYIPQEGGMRLNYDQKLPKIAKELTGFDGERVSFGEHWKAVKTAKAEAPYLEKTYSDLGKAAQAANSLANQYGRSSVNLIDGTVQITQSAVPNVAAWEKNGWKRIDEIKGPRENLIFKNPDGSPKTDITARVYPLDKARKMFEDQTAFTLFGRDQSYYSGIPPEMAKWIGDLFKSLGLKNLGNFDPAYAMSKSVTSRMATRGPSGGLVKWLFADMTREKQKIANVLMEMTEPFRAFVNTENGIKWINRASTDETWDDFSGLSKEEIPAAQAYDQFWSDLRDLITDRGVFVMEIDPATGKVTPRPGAKLPGYTPWAVGDHIYEMAGDKNREAEWKRVQEDFVEKWKEKFGENSEAMAREAIANLLGVKGMETGPGGEPLFGPVSLPHGMTLPESWRDTRPADSLNRYIRRVSQHLAWAEKVQYNPAARRVFNIKADPMGVDTSKTDPTMWAEAPDAWAYAVREGKRVRADWALNADENNPPDEPIDFAGDSANMNALLSSFKQASSPNPNLQAFSSAASAALMQAPTGLRDVGMSLVRAAQYAGPSAALRASMDYIANIPAKLREARQAGAMPGDLLEPEIVANSKAIARAMMKLARKMRAWSGREFLDNTGRVIIYDAVKAVILEGNGDHLVKEFGPAYSEGLSKEEIADQTAAVLSHRASNVSDAGSLPAGMLPQGGGLSAPLSLMRWSVAQYNTFAEDVVNPMLDGKGEEGMKRFLTLVLGSIVGGSVINGLLDDLLKRKPDHLTWGEWLNVFNDPAVDKATKAKEFAYAAASRAQVMGALGWIGDYLVAPAAREIAGGTRWANQTDIQYPAWIVGNQMAQTIGSYYNAVSNKRTDGRDFLDFLLEMGKINQNVRVAHGAIKAMQGEEKKGLRDQGVVERIYDVNSSTGKPAALETGMGPVFRSDPFNFTRQAMGSEDLGKLEGFLEERRRTGNVPSLDTWSQDRRYYQALTRLIGEEEAKKRREVDRKMDQEVRKKNREIRRLSR